MKTSEVRQLINNSNALSDICLSAVKTQTLQCLTSCFHQEEISLISQDCSNIFCFEFFNSTISNFSQLLTAFLIKTDNFIDFFLS